MDAFIFSTLRIPREPFSSDCSIRSLQSPIKSSYLLKETAQRCFFKFLFKPFHVLATKFSKAERSLTDWPASTLNRLKRTVMTRNLEIFGRFGGVYYLNFRAEDLSSRAMFDFCIFLRNVDNLAADYMASHPRK